MANLQEEMERTGLSGGPVFCGYVPTATGTTAYTSRYFCSRFVRWVLHADFTLSGLLVPISIASWRFNTASPSSVSVLRGPADGHRLPGVALFLAFHKQCCASFLHCPHMTLVTTRRRIRRRCQEYAKNTPRCYYHPCLFLDRHSTVGQNDLKGRGQFAQSD